MSCLVMSKSVKLLSFLYFAICHGRILFPTIFSSIKNKSPNVKYWVLVIFVRGYVHLSEICSLHA